MFVEALILAAAAILGVKILLVVLKRPPLPPGPKGLPLVGNIAGLPSPGEREWEHWLRHKDIYGPISSITTFGTTVILLHSPELALEILEKRSANYSNRPTGPLTDFVGFNDLLGARQYDKTFRLMRKTLRPSIGNTSAVMSYLSVLDKEVHRFLFRVLQEPGLLTDHARTMTGAIILKIAYGYTVEPHDDPLVDLADRSMAHVSLCVVPRLVNIIPALRYLPTWMPGAGWKKTCMEWRRTLRETREKPFKFSKQQVANGSSEKSFITNSLRSRDDTMAPTNDDFILEWTSASLYMGGADTSVHTLTSFFLTMTLFPDAQRKAQEEIDLVVGTSRLPVLSDRASLPYVNAVLMEALRWHPVAPMGLPHAAKAEDVVDGFYIPKGAIILPNVWWFTHDPAVYPNPSEFDPSRYLGPNPAPDPTSHVFGYGRRVCPGQHLADSSLWLAIAKSLAAFNIGRGLDENGREIDPITQFTPTPGLVSRIDSFKATIKPRSSQHEALIRQVEELHPWEGSDADEVRNIVI
ncbi:putative cytochrome P450 oxidoreductase OrdA-like protein [Nemania serpens]|nr:putative cytochrome P450 oxidoreductase OrdA-like protein [Nemania serpens]